VTTLKIQLVGEGLRDPGEDGARGPHSGLHIGIQRKAAVVDLVPATAPRVTFSLEVDVVATGDELDFRGPYVHGPRGGRFLYLSWGEIDRDGSFGMVQRMKIKFGSIERALVERALASGSTLHGTLPLTDEAGNPSSGTVKPDLITWTVVPDVPNVPDDDRA